MKKLLLVFLLFPYVLTAQKQGQERIDSLLGILQQLPDDTGKVLVLKDIAYLYAYSNADKGIQYGQQCLKLAESLGWKKGMANANNSIAVNYLNKADYSTALSCFFNSLQLNEELGDRIAIAKVTGNIGIVYDQQKNYPKALEYYHRGYAMARELGNTQSMAYSCENIASVHESLSAHDSALYYNLKARDLFQTLGNKNGLAGVLGNMGIVYKKMGDFSRALENDKMALSINRSLGDKNGVAANLGNIGAAYLSMATADSSGSGTARNSNLRMAIQYSDSAVALNKQNGNLDYLQEVMKTLYEAYYLLGDHRQAFAYYRQYIESRDSVFSMSNRLKIINLETERETMLKDKQLEIDRLAVAKKRNERVFYIAGIIALLLMTFYFFRNFRLQKWLNKELSVEKQKVEERSAELSSTLNHLRDTQDQLIVAEKQKENELLRRRISQDIHDDISSELTKISWVSALARTKAQKKDDEALIPLLDKIVGHSGETVAKLGEIIWTVNPQNDSLSSLLAYMRDYVAKFLLDTPFRYEIDLPDNVPDMPMNPELKRNLFLVMKEALHNAVKYSGASLISFTCQLTGDDYCFRVTDNGKGIEPGIVQGGGNGLANMRARMQTVRGTCSIISLPGGGTTVEMTGTFY